MELKHCAMTGIGIDDELAIRKPPSKVVGVRCWNHPIIVAIDHEHGMLYDGQIRRFFRTPNAQGRQLRHKRGHPDFFVTVF